MNPSFTLPDIASLSDLRTYLGRAARVEDGSVRLIADNGVLAVYTAILYPVGLLDETPTVLGLRTFALTAPVAFDSVVPIRSFLSRLNILAGEAEAAGAAGADPTTATTTEVEIPQEVNTVTWAAISPPRGGWAPLPDVSEQALRNAARAGVEEVSNAVPASAGDSLVRKVRAAVWGRPVNAFATVPAGAGFAADALGFLHEGEQVRLFEAGSWIRLTTSSGHVLVKQRAWMPSA